MKERRPIPSRGVSLEIENGSLISNLDSVTSLNDLSGDYGERKIILLRYPTRKPLKI